MSKDKGSKNNKKKPADKSKGKVGSGYKSEGKKATPALDAFAPKPDPKTDKKPKS